jgi:hypothetical protein
MKIITIKGSQGEMRARLFDDKRSNNMQLLFPNIDGAPNYPVTWAPCLAVTYSSPTRHAYYDTLDALEWTEWALAEGFKVKASGYGYGAWMASQAAMRRPDVQELHVGDPCDHIFDYGFIEANLKTVCIQGGISDLAKQCKKYGAQVISSQTAHAKTCKHQLKQILKYGETWCKANDITPPWHYKDDTITKDKYRLLKAIQATGSGLAWHGNLFETKQQAAVAMGIKSITNAKPIIIDCIKQSLITCKIEPNGFSSLNLTQDGICAIYDFEEAQLYS